MLIKETLNMAKATPPQIKVAGGIWEDKNPRKRASIRKAIVKRVNRTISLPIIHSAIIRGWVEPRYPLFYFVRQKIPRATKTGARKIAAI